MFFSFPYPIQAIITIHTDNVSLILSNMWPFFTLSRFPMILTLLKSTIQVFGRMFLSWGYMNLLMVRLKLLARQFELRASLLKVETLWPHCFISKSNKVLTPTILLKHSLWRSSKIFTLLNPVVFLCLYLSWH